MNIQTATIYAKHGYKIKRPCWNVSEYFMDTEPCIHISGEFYMSGDTYTVLSVEDLLADDWEIVSDANEKN